MVQWFCMARVGLVAGAARLYGSLHDDVHFF